MMHEYPHIGDTVATVADVPLSECAYIQAGSEGTVESLKASGYGDKDDDEYSGVKACVAFGPYLKVYVKTDLLTPANGS